LGYVMSIILAMLVGYLAGLLSFKAKSRWCTECGSIKCCPRCAGWSATAGAPSPDRGPVVVGGSNLTAVRGRSGVEARRRTEGDEQR